MKGDEAVEGEAMAVAGEGWADVGGGTRWSEVPGGGVLFLVHAWFLLLGEIEVLSKDLFWVS